MAQFKINNSKANQMDGEGEMEKNIGASNFNQMATWEFTNSLHIHFTSRKMAKCKIVKSNNNNNDK